MLLLCIQYRISNNMRIYDKYNNVFVAFTEGDISELSTLCPTECKYHYSMLYKTYVCILNIISHLNVVSNNINLTFQCEVDISIVLIRSQYQ